ncbi:MAG: helix-hairpin-helix domain-containing protein [Planctomycetes bacterium]|nr:helix-hairpin-helix domain-containing protein [Planctomycetota bacterium]
MSDAAERIAAEMKLKPERVAAAVALLREGAPVPYIAHYAREKTGGLDEARLHEIEDRLQTRDELGARRAAILSSIKVQDKLDDALRARIEAAATRAELEDLYLPYAPRKKTRAQEAIKKGLEPLAELILKQETDSGSVESAAEKFLSKEHGVMDLATALAGAREIVSELLSERPDLREIARALIAEQGKLVAKPKPAKVAERRRKGRRPKPGAEAAAPAANESSAAGEIAAAPESAPAAESAPTPAPEAATPTEAASAEALAPEPEPKAPRGPVFSAPLATLSSHRLAAVLKREEDKEVSLQIEAPREKIVEELKKKAVTNAASIFNAELSLALEECVDRHLLPGMKADLRRELKARADKLAIETFLRTLRGLLLQPPFGARRVLAVQPGKKGAFTLVALNAGGLPLAQEVVDPSKDEESKTQAVEAAKKLIEGQEVEAVAIGKGKKEAAAAELIRAALAAANKATLPVVYISEAGAYAASRAELEELPEADADLRAAVYLGRRLQDPLAELVKLDPRSVLGGMYPQDVDRNDLRKRIEQTFASCVARVGVDVNGADAGLLRFVPGVDAKLAKTIVERRQAQGRIPSRAELLSIEGLKEKEFEFAAAFLRVPGSAEPLDETLVHPRHYALVEKIARAQNATVKELLAHPEKIAQADPKTFAGPEADESTLKEIFKELRRGGKDPRGAFTPPNFDSDIKGIEDLKEGQTLFGVVSMITPFGVFVDIGVHQDGLVHLSEVSHEFIRDIGAFLPVGRRVRVLVKSVDVAKKRIGLSIKALQSPAGGPRRGRAEGQGRSSRDGRGTRPPRGRRPAREGAGGPGGTGTRGPREGAVAGARGGPGGPGGSGGRGGAGGERKGGRGGRDGREAGAGGKMPRVSASGKPLPDYSKFFVKGKRRDDKKKKTDVRKDFASRNEVREVIEQQKKKQTKGTLADLLKQAGVEPNE